ncbi:MAG: ABC transporter ATP-binding protein [Methanospirillaceae archaeon]|nr:ABC transporter ATP-binding protein [Methanospirillaceae archaeon]
MTRTSDEPGAITIEDPVILTENLSVSYEGHQVLEKVNLCVRKGDWYAIIGPNGGGKTTLIKAILGLISPGSGKIRVFGQDPKDVRERIGYVPQYQTFQYAFPIRVREVVFLGRMGRMKGLFQRYGAEDSRAVHEAMARMRIEHLADRSISTLSGGERQRTIIARALAGEPDLLLLDEPTVYVDDLSRDIFFSSLTRVRETCTVLLITHDISVVHAHVTKIACLNTRLFTHDSDQITDEMVAQSYGCPVDLITHGDIPHRVLERHNRKEADEC